MHIIDSSAAMAEALDQPSDPDLHHLLRTWQDRLSGYDVDLSELVRFVIVDSGDQLQAAQAALDSSIDLTAGSWENAHRHPGGWAEIVFVLSDDGYGCVLLVPDRKGVDRTLAELCRQHASTPAELEVTTTP